MAGAQGACEAVAGLAGADFNVHTGGNVVFEKSHGGDRIGQPGQGIRRGWRDIGMQGFDQVSEFSFGRSEPVFGAQAKDRIGFIHTRNTRCHILAIAKENIRKVDANRQSLT